LPQLGVGVCVGVRVIVGVWVVLGVIDGVKVVVGVDVLVGDEVVDGVNVCVGVREGVKVGVSVGVGLGVMDGVNDAVGLGIKSGGATLMALLALNCSMIPRRTVVKCKYGQACTRKGVINGWLKSTPIRMLSPGPPASSLGEISQYAPAAGSDCVTVEVLMTLDEKTTTLKYPFSVVVVTVGSAEIANASLNVTS
jgi:hypothetical protein